MAVDYRLYLVTDSTMVPKGSSVAQQVERAVANGATVVQLREKNIDTRDFIERAREVQRVTRKHGVPLIINDRVDVALAVDADGVHVGQDDMPAEKVRELIGEGKILGVSVSNEREMAEVLSHKHGVVDYVGIGAVYATSTKDLKKAPMDVEGVQEILDMIDNDDMKTVAIGGISQDNAAHVVAESVGKVSGRALDGVAVVSCIMASTTPDVATRELSDALSKGYQRPNVPYAAFDHFANSPPLIHHITNDVVKNFSANVTLAIGAAPVMSGEPQDFKEFAKLNNAALVLNTGTGTDQMREVYKAAIEYYNKSGNPIIFDPVACGATAYRREFNGELLETGQFTVIKGNASEILNCAGVNSQMRGVDSNSDFDIDELKSIAKTLSTDKNSVVAITGKIDIVAYKDQVCTIQGGDAQMGRITGTGCALSGVIAAFVCATPKDPFNATVNALSVYKYAGKRAADSTKGPGSFQMAFLDELYNTGLKKGDLSGVKVTF